MGATNSDAVALALPTDETWATFLETEERQSTSFPKKPRREALRGGDGAVLLPAPRGKLSPREEDRDKAADATDDGVPDEDEEDGDDVEHTSVLSEKAVEVSLEADAEKAAVEAMATAETGTYRQSR
ncbi:hypothetical protein CBR_g48780 [Chara braunii]|uniref:Uncharacterized protein n=1 Tax=Chara braunii TaxID=69332 RepID=A0A388M3B3_CHABU|nr:hypothetical protein CBR_g48780 [Chara braunii]|eukprot:GBG89070.1 hypothetical protein CBR_g48780 [Chara braunii]